MTGDLSGEHGRKRNRRGHIAPCTKDTAQAPSQNVVNLQQRASGVLPVRIDVPRAGTSHQFLRALVVDEETVVSLRYKRR